MRYDAAIRTLIGLCSGPCHRSSVAFASAEDHQEDQAAGDRDENPDRRGCRPRRRWMAGPYLAACEDVARDVDGHEHVVRPVHEDALPCHTLDTKQRASPVAPER
jgi:hypothetical protein